MKKNSIMTKVMAFISGISKVKSVCRSPYVEGGGGMRLLFLLLLFTACHGNDALTAVSTSREVSLGISVRAMEMEQTGESAATRLSKNPDETEIKTLYLVQFNGNGVTSTVVKSGNIIRDEDEHTAMFDFVAIDATCRVYAVANFNPNVVDGTTLEAFEKSMVAYSPSTSVAESGLPLCGYLDFNPATINNIPLFTLRAMVAKLIVTYTVEPAAFADFKSGTTATSLDVVLKNVTTGTSFGFPTATAKPYRPTNVTYTDVEVGKTGATYTYYVPENIAGNSSENITRWNERSQANAPANALCFEIKGRDKTNENWVVISSFIGDPNAPNAFNIYRNHAYMMTATVKNTNTLDERITLVPIPIYDLNEPLGNRTANCYLITDNDLTNYSFNATVRGNNATAVPGINYSTLPDLAEAREARVIWQTGTNASTLVIDPALVRLKDGKVIFTTSGEVNEGNAVIGLFSSSDPTAECLWSWHIWKVNGPLASDVYCTKTPSLNTALPNFNMMALNLGAYNNTQGNPGSIGLLYQWGRKDPFPGPEGFNATEPSNIYGSWNNGGITGYWNGDYGIKTSTTNTLIGTEAWAVKYPTTFIASSSDWMSVRNDNLWGNPWVAGGLYGFNGSQGTKSIYDPCPVGYRVPPQDTWGKQTNTRYGKYQNNGMVLDNIATGLWYPNVKVRGPLGNLGVLPGGVYTSSSPYYGGSVVGHLYFLPNGVCQDDDYDKGGCTSVRCVRE